MARTRRNHQPRGITPAGGRRGEPA